MREKKNRGACAQDVGDFPEAARRSLASGERLPFLSEGFLVSSGGRIVLVLLRSTCCLVLRAPCVARAPCALRRSTTRSDLTADDGEVERGAAGLIGDVEVDLGLAENVDGGGEAHLSGSHEGGGAVFHLEGAVGAVLEELRHGERCVRRWRR